MAFLTGSRSLDAAEKLRVENDIALFIVTLDSRGAFFAHKNGSKTVPGFHVVLVEATGAGDGFNSGVITGILETAKSAPDRVKALNDLSNADIEKIIHRANAVGALTCTRPGAIPALPNKSRDHRVPRPDGDAKQNVFIRSRVISLDSFAPTIPTNFGPISTNSKLATLTRRRSHISRWLLIVSRIQPC